MACMQLFALSYLVLRCEGAPNATSHLRGVAKSPEEEVGMTHGPNNLSTPYTTLFGIPTLNLAVKAPEWTAWFSDEGWGSASCNGLISGMDCSGRYCDKVRLGCDYSVGMDHGASHRNSWFSDDSESVCSSGQFVTAVQCKGRYCDDMRITCTSVPSTRQSNCRWLGRFSDGSGQQVFPEGARLTGLACTGRYCDDLRPRVCDVHQYCTVAGKPSGSWMWVENIATSGVKEYSYHSTESNKKSSSNEWSKSLTTSVSAGFEYAGAFGSVEVSSSLARTQVRSLERALEEGNAATQTYDISPDTVGMGLWQFEFTASDTCGHRETIKTHEYIFTDGRFRSPCCLPGYAMGVHPPESYTCYQKAFQVDKSSHCKSCGEDGAAEACGDL